ncbi:uncharacterized protein LY89DRAFT_734757 [Mollisia scopiformis]|uniref:Uncharacterized protein n=1 Tax=Mollisia scopiformis TaxID=149040 RepID=A0A194X717_MOLSC|nr:uncharacterized protein LY89DRAFT_734757 [Mollisia scopiformis]KUJ15597.1 hypothetical protein LY89DRAFT_734757 [Mollisia scopiformis]
MKAERLQQVLVSLKFLLLLAVLGSHASEFFSEWQIWKNEQHVSKPLPGSQEIRTYMHAVMVPNYSNMSSGRSSVEKSAWFELADNDLREISRLIQSHDEQAFSTGLERLEYRVAQSQQASQSLQDPSYRAPKWQLKQWQEQVRKGPPVLTGIAKHLKDPSRRPHAMQMLANICDDRFSAKTFKPPVPVQQTNTSPQGRSSRESKPAKPLAVAVVPQVQVRAHLQGKEFGLGYDPGEYVEEFVTPANMFAPSVVPLTASKRVGAKTPSSGI